ncbi:predicted protein [Phaeodactylum tricornutum CCAP 1055/1]|uniref:Uncharacterized protein n=1 Tax=Phaeodactylum tricornutum (strain CCAP 1055/1) TaxID=556484 RepID=B7S4K9_PHATC|nr:predicted protein [Phaeodactylum tricornutum CCAP 1055/1]EEC42515.1 predicted protein [Phaeodactylum tricornutum CCAP 1055/1]|eukprot:XP_002176499.1 predicted protein [Phaeodactylum tricornutum CCAP 1055/1]
MPREQTDRGGMGIAFNSGGGGGGHRKVAFALGISIWISGAILVYSLIPTWARGQRWTGTVAFAMQNLIFGLASCYLQPYKETDCTIIRASGVALTSRAAADTANLTVVSLVEFEFFSSLIIKRHEPTTLAQAFPDGFQS